MPAQPTELERRFHAEMIASCEACRRLTPPYNPTRFLQMVATHGGKRTAEMLLASTEPSTGFAELFTRGKRLDLSVEYLVLKSPWRSLFTPEELATARKRLRDHQFEPPPEDAAA